MARPDRRRHLGGIRSEPARCPGSAAAAIAGYGVLVTVGLATLVWWIVLSHRRRRGLTDIVGWVDRSHLPNVIVVGGQLITVAITARSAAAPADAPRRGRADRRGVGGRGGDDARGGGTPGRGGRAADRSRRAGVRRPAALRATRTTAAGDRRGPRTRAAPTAAAVARLPRRKQPTRRREIQAGGTGTSPAIPSPTAGRVRTIVQSTSPGGAAMSGWNFAEIWEVVAEQIPDAPAQVQGDRIVTWREFDERANGVAHTLLEAGVQHQDKVAQYLYNCPEYLESMFATFKAGLVPVNTNYRYADDELRLPVGQRRRRCRRVPRHVRRAPSSACATGCRRSALWLWVDDGSGPCPDWATPYEEAAAIATPGGSPAPWGRNGDDLYLLYTGGTTGMPKGVMWRQDDLRPQHPRRGHATLGYGQDAGELEALARAGRRAPGIVPLPGLPADARHRLLDPARSTCRAAARRSRSRAAPSTSTSCSTRSSAQGQHRSRSSATRSPSRCCEPSTPTRSAGTSRRSGRSSRRA